ncbi:MAG: hypothetical protein M3021_06850 [Actinomycetota bacterium]|nr:hypothetical protein [Actinomycetota bacterium]
MFDGDQILQSPAAVTQDQEANEPLRLVLEDPHRSRLRWLLTASVVCVALIVVAGLIVWIGHDPNNPGFWHVSLVSALFWLSVTQGMMALSALMRVAHASWRYPLNRLLDISSLFGLWVGALLPFLVVAREHI